MQGENVIQRAERKRLFIQAHLTSPYPAAHLKGPLISMCPHVNVEGGVVGKFF